MDYKMISYSFSFKNWYPHMEWIYIIILIYR